MAASMASHKKHKVCTNRPIYRDGRRERAVKVFTINQESRYLLVQGVPDIKITEELLKLFSLYGTIQEYRILDDLPAEEFTKNYWIKYADIQAARVAKRKMDDHSFYGGFLHVTYAPEYETIQDTREKLQQRRMGVARRLRKLSLEKEQQTEGDDIESISAASSNFAPPAAQSRPLPSMAWGCDSASSSASTTMATHPPSGTDVRDGAAHFDAHQDPLRSEGERKPFPSLPAPPRQLPPWQWDIPSQPEFPRLRTAHDTLPPGFNPFLDGGAHGARDQSSASPQQQQQQQQQRLAPPGTFIGPQHPSESISQGAVESRLALNSGSNTEQHYLEAGARPKTRPESQNSERSYNEKYIASSHPEYHSHSETNTVHRVRQIGDHPDHGTGACHRVRQSDHGTGADHRVRHGDEEVQKQSAEAEGARPKLVPRRRLGPTATSPDMQQKVKAKDRPAANTSISSSQQHFVPRVVSTRTKRSAASLEEEMDDGRTMTSLLVTGNASFDQTVQAIRQQMVQTGAVPNSTIQTALIQSRNQERMGTLPRRPPVKRQRI